MLTSVHNPRIRNAAKLRDRRERDSQRRILIDGAREVSRALQSGVRLVEVFACQDLCRSDRTRETLELLEASGISIAWTTPAVFAKVAYGDRQDGIVGIAETPSRILDSFVLPADPLIAIVEGVEKPGNLGAICRTADGAGLAALIASGKGTDLYNPNAIRASLGTVFRVPCCSAPSLMLLDWLRQLRARIFVARVEGALPYTEVDFSGPTAIVLGSEANGLTPVWNGPEVTAIRIPMHGLADSLNVSAAAAVLFYEAMRQRECLLGRFPE